MLFWQVCMVIDFLNNCHAVILLSKHDHHHHRGVGDNAQPIIPYEEFQKMFDEYTESAAVSRAQIEIGEGVRLGALKIPETSTIIENLGKVRMLYVYV
jgi:hypothetical protein